MDPKTGLEALLSFYDPIAIGEAVADLDWGIRHEIELLVDMMKHGPTASVKLAARRELRQMFNEALTVSGHMTRLRKIGEMEGPGGFARLEQESVTLLGLGSTVEEQLRLAVHGLPQLGREETLSNDGIGSRQFASGGDVSPPSYDTILDSSECWDGPDPTGGSEAGGADEVGQDSEPHGQGGQHLPEETGGEPGGSSRGAGQPGEPGGDNGPGGEIGKGGEDQHRGSRDPTEGPTKIRTSPLVNFGVRPPSRKLLGGGICGGDSNPGGS